ncbi:OmpA family protein [Winogradskyella jejuensis]|uniref:WD40-like Beta Propeller Repeat n=1 Tax=Winogradskyella jejuensis TaxID=1089305 RepID=A0A1M5TJQ8_9FLAO|nr:OmpA family protein [Winogradskyella jejuensis]SHH50916.1 WD40-like Beta Propeller Repeat [Winogradskyella jejuensis]
MKTRLTIILLTLCFSSSFAQLKLADKFYKSYSYIKAIELYKEVVKKGDSSMHVLTRLGDAYYNNTQTEESALWYGLAVDKYERKIDNEYIFKYIQSLVSIKDYEKAELWVAKLREKQDKDTDDNRFIQDNFDIYKISKQDNDRRVVNLYNVDFNTDKSDFGSYVKDNTLYFASSRDTSSKLYVWNKEPFLDIYQTEIIRGNKTLAFGSPSKVSGDRINSNYHESSVAITNDGKTIYFTRDNLTKRDRLDYDKKGTTHLELFRAKLDEETNQWTDLELLPFNLELYSTAHPALSPDNKKLYFASDREGGYGLSDLYVVDIKEDGSFSEPRNLGDKINTAGRDTFPFVAKDGTLYYSSDGFVNYGLLDIFKSDIINNPDAESVNIGEPFNSSFDDFAYIFDTDTEEGYLSSNREGGKGSDDIYTFNTYICQQSIEGVVRDELTEEVIPDATVKLVDDKGKVIAEMTTDADGKYEFSNQLCEKTYTVVASKDDYKDDQKTVTTTDEKDKVNIADLMLTPLIIDNQIVINPIFFDFDKWNIRTDAQFELENIVDVMRKHPTMVIKIESHTDSRGGERYNMRLSDRRAKSTRDYIISRGIEANRIESAIGYGESQLLNRCANGIKCSKEEHQKNRRSYFYIIKE